ncbi:Glycosyltransferase, catalytic subunit of cellulose synthase and poly-beta-1,6-N-acetylglucosamine synthase [Paenibacillus sp. UNCCL117]|uniref:glycosyltransferase family 2 protein n=1 Tax=unclassified Paenibacillus TaxID=185978 RepID=UPI00087E9F2C|nr:MULTISPECIES: glycosyltransferase [unclassified Paenibacillus]SDC17476.1 Glycosyltransferase, catalytic subunit of cellulose synthase and poly-beta-1,6-N-acetylglucosamine synthase [Paenibacillus sp. cl123]SFW18018.1 Glycosyltransferase, catalytic subunit of cellulose synthase and poly-beta-1,6-N-acetylglucosamine synthase [Paenibacillus sp. UNCCL117]
MTAADILMLVSVICIWSLLLVNVVLIIAGYLYYIQVENQPAPELRGEAPFVSILVPAHNEGKVIVKTVESLLALQYPRDRYEIIVINDNSSDNSSSLLGKLQLKHPERNLIVLNTDAVTGGKGKSNALNLGFAKSKGELIAIYDADNTPEKKALLYLVSEIAQDPKLGAVIGKFRTRNRDTNLLTRFINIETLSFQWMAQAGRWKLFKLCTIPGTNFIMRREIIERIGGWDVKAIAEDTEISFRIYRMGYRIKFQPKAVTWEQEPQTVKVWFKQRTRWAKGNIYVIVKNLKLVADPAAKLIRFDILYFLSIYFLLLTSLIMSDMLLILNALGYVTTTIAGFSSFLWLLAITLFVVGTFVTLVTEKGEMRLSNLWLILLMYISYCQLWMVVAAYGLYTYLKDLVFRREAKWYKTERF